MSSLDLFGVMYGADGGGFYHKIPCENYNKDWQSSMEKIGASGWNEFDHLFFHPDGDLYGVQRKSSQLKKAPPPSNPSALQQNWWANATLVSDNMENFKLLFFDPEGNLYGDKDDKLYTGPLPSNTDEKWLDSAKLVGASGWSFFNFLFFDPMGILHGVNFKSGTFHKRSPPTDPTDDWLKTSTTIGTDWRGFRFLFFMSNGELYAVLQDRENLHKGSPPSQGMPCEKWLGSAGIIAEADFNVIQFLMSPVKVYNLRSCKKWVYVDLTNRLHSLSIYHVKSKRFSVIRLNIT